MTSYTYKKIDILPQGYYPAAIIKVETTAGDYGTQEKFTFDLGNGRELLGWASGSFTNKSKMFYWAQSAIFAGQPIPEDYVLDTNAFVGKQVVLLVTQRVNSNGTFNKVEDVLPAQLSQPAQESLFAQNQPASSSPTVGDQTIQPLQNLSQWAQQVDR